MEKSSSYYLILPHLQNFTYDRQESVAFRLSSGTLLAGYLLAGYLQRAGWDMKQPAGCILLTCFLLAR